jgi:glycine cleavage system H protein
VLKVNSILKASPEAINQDPYGNGWLAVIKLEEGKSSIKPLLDPQTYLSKIKLDAEQELNAQ